LHKIIEEVREKMMLKKFRCLVLAMVLILVFVSCNTFAANKPIKLVFGHNYPAGHYYEESVNYFKKLIEKNSKGQIVVDVFPGAQLGGPGEMLQATRNGAQQITISYLGGFISGLYPKLATFEVPGLITDYALLSKIIARFDSLIDPDELVAKTGVRAIGFFPYAMKQFYSKVPVYKLKDIKGLKVRLAEVPVSVAMCKAIGGVPTVVSNADAYTAFATGVADATVGDLANIYGSKFYEPLKYCALISLQCGFSLMVINNSFWEGLTTTQQKIIGNAANKCTKFVTKATLEGDKKYRQLLIKAGMKFTKPDRAPFIDKTKTVWSQFGDAELIKKIEAMK
jgi:TRAP-type C4-dicarboxylate transport system substrate-binding protein